jgi:hypothetical protein
LSESTFVWTDATRCRSCLTNNNKGEDKRKGSPG